MVSIVIFINSMKNVDVDVNVDVESCEENYVK